MISDLSHHQELGKFLATKKFYSELSSYAKKKLDKLVYSNGDFIKKSEDMKDAVWSGHDSIGIQPS